MKKMLLVFSFLLVGAGCIPVDAEPPASVSADDSALWIVSGVNAQAVQYVPIEWFDGDEALTKAHEDGCREDQACVPNGFYWRYINGEEYSRTWILGDTSSIVVQLICNTESCTPDNPRENGYKTMTFAEYNVATQSCRENPLECPYYSIGTEMDFFDVQFSEDGVLTSMIQRYVL